MADVSNQQIRAWLDTTRDKWEYMFWVNWPFKMYLTGGGNKTFGNINVALAPKLV